MAGAIALAQVSFVERKASKNYKSSKSLSTLGFEPITIRLDVISYNQSDLRVNI